MPGIRRLPEAGDAGVRQRPADPGAAEHRRGLVHAGHRRVAGRPRLDQQHVPHQRPAVRQPDRGVRRRTSCRPRRSPSRPSAAARRSPRSSGPAAAAARSTARRSTSAASSPAAAWRRTTSAPADAVDDAPFIAAFGLQFDHPAGFAGQAPFPRRRPGARDRLDRRADDLQPGQGDAPAGARLRHRQVRPQRLHLRQHERPQDRLRPRAVLAAPRTAPTRSPTSAKGQWADVKVKITARRPLDGKTAGILVKVERLDRRPLAGPAVPHVGHARDRDLADLAGRARLHRRLRGLRRREVPVLAGRRLRRCSSPGSSARTPTSSRASTGRAATSR